MALPLAGKRQIHGVKLVPSLLSIVLGTSFLCSLGAESLWIAGEGGVYRGEINEDTGELSEPKLACEFGSGSFLAIHPELDVIYASYREKPDFGYVSLVPTGDADGEMKIQSLQVLEAGSGSPAHLAVSDDGLMLAGTHYSSKANFFFQLGEHGEISKESLRTEQWGKGPQRAQRQSRPHWGGFSDGSTTFHSVDLGADEVWTYEVDTDANNVELLHRVKFPLGTGPRHMAMNPKSEYAYVCGEMSLEVTTLHYDQSNKRFSPLQHISAVGEGEKKDGSSLSEIQVHPNGLFLYTAVRGNNLISAFSIDPETGMLSVVERQDSLVDRPRNFTVTQNGKWLVAAGQNSSDLVVFSIDQSTGALDPTEWKVSVPKPVCVRAWGRL